jgi:hypothetical protein
MSARLNMNEVRYYSWKGKTFNQITSAFQKNKIVLPNTNGNILFNARPLPIYRRETFSKSAPASGNRRTSASIDQLNMPNGYSLTSNTVTCTIGVSNVLDGKEANETTNKYQNGSCVTTNPCMSQEYNARRRVRSSGMIKKNNATTGATYDPYYTSTKQLLISRNKTFEQNQYNYIRQGDSSAKPGSNSAADNVYSAHGMSTCAKYHITSELGNNTFKYQWFDGAEYPVTFEDGYYDLDDLNQQFKLTMNNNKHYLIVKSTLSKTFLMNIGFNAATKKIELQAYAYNKTTYSESSYEYPFGNNWNTYVSLSTNAATSVVPVFKILNNGFQDVIGFAAGNYPSVLIRIDGAPSKAYQHASTNTYTYNANQTSISTSNAKLLPMYSLVYYKPNNSQYAQQGAVSASSLITRLKYNTITNNSYKYQAAYGMAMANALAYGVPEGGYTIKDKIGYPIKKTPTFSKYSDGFAKCESKSFSNMI